MNRTPGVSRQIQKNSPETNGHAYIAIPQGVDRESFIETCYRRNRVTIITDFGAVINECYILDTALQEIQFPEKEGEKGSCVCYISNVFSNKPVVIGVIYENDESSLLNEQMFRVRKKLNGTEILVQGDPKNNGLTVNVTSIDPSVIKVAVKGNEENQVIVESSGSIELKADKKVDVVSFGEINVQIKDVEEQEAVYKTIINKDNLSYSRKNEKGDIEVLVNDEKVSLNRKTEKINETFWLDDSGVHLITKEGMTVDFSDSELNIKTGKSTLQMNDSIINFNGGGLEGLVEINQLTAKLNSLVQQVNTFISLYNTHIHPATMGTTSPTVSTATSVDTFSKTDYENEKIKQG